MQESQPLWIINEVDTHGNFKNWGGLRRSDLSALIGKQWVSIRNLLSSSHLGILIRRMIITFTSIPFLAELHAFGLNSLAVMRKVSWAVTVGRRWYRWMDIGLLYFGRLHGLLVNLVFGWYFNTISAGCYATGRPSSYIYPIRVYSIACPFVLLVERCNRMHCMWVTGSHDSDACRALC